MSLTPKPTPEPPIISFRPIQPAFPSLSGTVSWSCPIRTFDKSDSKFLPAISYIVFMGLRKLFKPQKELTRDECETTLEKNGALAYDPTGSYKRKFKFNEFSKYAQTQTQDTEPLRPVGVAGNTRRSDRVSASGAAGATDPTDSTQQIASNGGDQYASGSQDNYGGKPYDPYAPGETQPSYQQQQPNTDGAQQLQEQKPDQRQSYDPYAADTMTVDTDFNNYPGAAARVQQELYENHEEVNEEEEEINRIVRQTKDTREATVQSSGNILRHLRQADDTATNTMGTLGSQREKMYQMERTVNTMDTQQRFLDDHVKDLEHYNRGLFHIKASNPFTRKSRQRATEQKFMAHRQADRERDAELSGQLYNSQRTIITEMKEPRDYDNLGDSQLRDQADYDERVKAASRYLTQDHDEEDERMEVEYSQNMEEAQKLAQNLKSKANVISQELTDQNKSLKDISEKVNKVDDKMVLTTNRIRGI